MPQLLAGHSGAFRPFLSCLISSVMDQTKTCIPIPLEENVLRDVVQKAKDWALMHGVGMRSKTNFSEDALVFAPFTLLPSVLPKTDFERAVDAQMTINKLMHRVAHSHDFLTSALSSTIKVDDFTKRLYQVYDTVRTEGFKQRLSLGLLRSDYLPESSTQSNRCKQVEINTIASSFAGISTTLRSVHGYILTELGYEDKVNHLPENKALSGLCEGIAEAWKLFDNPKSVIMFLVEDVTYNICDQRFMEFEVRRLLPGTRVIRKSLAQLIESAKLSPSFDLIVDGDTVAVVYMRAGYDPLHYRDDEDWRTRLLMERSTAIKCPTIQYHLAGTKKVQQVLSRPGEVEKFLDKEETEIVRAMFTNLYSLDFDEDGEEATRMALENPERFVLKPQREGGGNNVYGKEIADTLRKMKGEERSSWILMDRIRPTVQESYLVRSGQSPSLVSIVSELGIFGVIIGDYENIMTNRVVGHMLRSKMSEVNEGGVAAGLGALDSPYLV